MATFIRLVDYDSAEEKEYEFHNLKNYHIAKQLDFKKVPGESVVYQISKKAIRAYVIGKPLGSIAPAKIGMRTGNNSRFIRFWFEIGIASIGFGCRSSKAAMDSRCSWFPYNKGGSYRKWFGNNEYVVFWYNDGQLIKETTLEKYPQLSMDNLGWKISNEKYFFLPEISWSFVASSNFAARLSSYGFLFDVGGSCAFPPINSTLLFVAYLCSKVASFYINAQNPTLNYQVSDVANLPWLPFECPELLKSIGSNISIGKHDWDIRENSWDFSRSPLLTNFDASRVDHAIDENITDWFWPSVFTVGISISLATQVEMYKKHWTSLFQELRTNEEKLNSAFIDLYELQDELTASVPYTEITILQEELIDSVRKEERLQFDEDVLAKQFISYGVGCLFGRYSVEKDGLILANAGAMIRDFKAKIPNSQYLPNNDGILPLTDEDDFSDDLPTAFKSWLRYISGSHYDDNLRWIEERLGLDLRGFFDRDFYKDHIKRYKSRPIYWMVSSPSGAFRALIYLHRYTKDTVGKILNDYVRPYRTKIDQKSRGLESIADSSSSSAGEKTKAKKRLAQLEKYKAEIEAWEKESLYPMALKRIELDLDDGVKVNYRKLEGILEPVKQLEAKEED